MVTNITPRLGGGRQIVESYGDGGFKISGKRYTGSVLIFLEETLAWPVEAVSGISAASLAPVIGRQLRPRILVIGCGKTFASRPDGLDAALREANIGIEWMDTGAACRTFNVLLLEDRDVAAALIAVE